MDTTTALMRLPKTSEKKQSKAMKVKTALRQLDEGDEVVDKIWEMYQKQLKRTHEMMLVCEQLQAENEALKRAQKLLAENATSPKEPKERERKLEPISYDKLNTLTKTLKKIFVNQMPRDSYAQALVHMLYTLYQLRGQAVPDQLFAAADVTEVSGFRYSGFLKNARMMQYGATTKKGYYLLTEAGKAFVQGKITTEEEFCAATGITRVWQIRK